MILIVNSINMQNLIINLLLKIISPEKIGQLVAKAISKLLNHAKEKRGSTWDSSKKIINQIRKWSNLFIQVYDDDTLTEEEEQIIADEIAKMTSAPNINKLLRDVFNGKE